MAFHFTLEAVLRYRQSLEEREQQRLQALLAARTKLRQEIEALGERRLARLQAVEGALEKAPVPAVEIQLVTLQLNGIERQQELLRASLQKLEADIAEQAARYRQARQQREVLESLRQGQWREYRLMQQRREQAALDEMHLLRRSWEQA
jgi:flagellar FliJ protein